MCVDVGTRLPQDYTVRKLKIICRISGVLYHDVPRTNTRTTNTSTKVSDYRMKRNVGSA